MVYVFGIPSFVYLFGGCRAGLRLDFPGREIVALVLYVFGSCYALGYEMLRFRWKALPENQGRYVY